MKKSGQMKSIALPEQYEVESNFVKKWSFADLHGSYLAWIILFLSALVSAVAWYVSYTSVMHAAEERFRFKVEDIQASVQRRMEEHEAMLWSGIGVFKASKKVDRTEWYEFVNALNLETFLPGLQGMGYARFMRAGEQEAHIAEVRADGFPDFTIRPAGKREFYSSIVYLEPFSGRNLRAFGYDMFSEPTRRAAMSRARDTGKAAISGMVTLVQETASDVQRGFLMYLPHYKKGMPLETLEDRRAALQGFVYSPFRMNDLMRGILGRGDEGIDFHIYDGGQKLEGRQMYKGGLDGSTAEASPSRTAFTSTHVISVGGREWALDFVSGPNFISAGEESQPFIVAAGAILIDLLLFLTISSLTNQRRNAIKMARGMTQELRLAKETAERSTEIEIVLRRAAEETNAKLEQANDGLLKFSSIVAHDLRAPLKRIETFVEILKEDYNNKFDDEGQDILTRIDRGSSRMRMMLDSLHSYAKFSSVSIEGKTAGISSIVNDAIENLQGSTGNAKITTSLESGLIVSGDRILLGHVLQNLISNSVKFCDKEQPEILIEAKPGENNRVEVSVSDNGIGIEPEFASQVFNMFERLHDEDEYEGTGIGLSICRKIISDHHGDIAVDTSFTNGTKIHFYLPKALLDVESIDDEADMPVQSSVAA
ncbi:MAG: hypothetical protein DHS20C08_11550 [Rhodomicrobium sp.]|nr:MAG: hypothetical protein DHS20C08_11550 [Rhodomicrobium sp.]